MCCEDGGRLPTAEICKGATCRHACMQVQHVGHGQNASLSSMRHVAMQAESNAAAEQHTRKCGLSCCIKLYVKPQMTEECMYRVRLKGSSVRTAATVRM